MPRPLRPMLTVGVIARRNDQPIHRVEYIIRSRKIEPLGMAGNARVFSEADAARIAEELRRIDGAPGDRTGPAA